MSPVEQRLRTGLWLQFHRETRAGEFDPLPLNEYTRDRVRAALWPEIGKYQFKPRDDARRPAQDPRLSAEHQLGIAIDVTWLDPGLQPRAGRLHPPACLVIQSIADYLCRVSEIVPSDRRAEAKRAGAGSS